MRLKEGKVVSNVYLFSTEHPIKSIKYELPTNKARGQLHWV